MRRRTLSSIDSKSSSGRTLTPTLSLGRALTRGAPLSAEGEGVRISPPMVERLCAWFDGNARDLPWRKRARTGYSALVAEMMLQQTQVSRVAQRFGEFMRAFPTVRALAAADEQRVLALWQGMGYYRRARNLHAAARMIVREFGGRVPRHGEDLMRLPGVGRYTAGAIASMVYGERVPIVDGNVERVLARVFAPRNGGAIAKPQAWAMAEALVKRAARPGVLNEAVMELGATVCVPAPAAPRCAGCPVARWCAARQMGTQAEIPAARLRAKRRAVHHHAVIITRAGSDLVLLEQRNGEGMWSGMWQTPTTEGDQPLDDTALAAMLPVGVREMRKRGEFVHHTTHRHIRFHVYQATSSVRSRRGTWRRVDDLDDLPMSNAQRRVLAFLRTD
jgi:A/G-specific adenine glycosylase